MLNHLRKPIRVALISTILFVSVVFVFITHTIWDLMATYESKPNESLPNSVDVNSILSLTQYAENHVQQWQDSLFLESYSANYIITEQEGAFSLTLTDTVKFRFAGWRNDWLKGVAETLGFAHLLAHIEIDTNEGKLISFNHSQGTGFGFDAPLDIVNWPLNEKELFLICDQHGAKEFRQTHNEQKAGVYVASTRVGRNWEVTYGSQDSSTFACVVNIDSGEVSIQENGTDWQEVYNIFE